MIAREAATSNRLTVQVPPWPIVDEASVVAHGYSLPVSGVPSGELSPYATGESALAALHRLLSSSDSEPGEVHLVDAPVDPFSSDEFRIYEFKVRRCARGRSHDWTECPFAHPGEKARRRDPRKYCYSGTSCSDFRKGNCKKGDACEFAHGVFESWLHPERYRTQPCKDGTACRRRVCFFAHTPEQLRVLPNNQQQSSPRSADSYDGSPLRLLASLDAYLSKGMSSSPISTLVPMPASPSSDSPPISPLALPRRAIPQGVAVDDMIASMKRLQLSKCTWGVGHVLSGFRSPKGLSSVPSTPTAASMTELHRSEWCGCGRKYDANIINGGESTDSGGFPDVDVGWVSELVK